jgi:hypothetical protein
MNSLLSSSPHPSESPQSTVVSSQTPNVSIDTWEAQEAERILHSAHQIHQEMMEVLDVLGWDALPGAFITTIQDDIMGFVEEVKGQFKSTCPFVALRRQRVTFWVEQVLQDPSLEAEAIEALHVKSL